jgi:hypothetical protein
MHFRKGKISIPFLPFWRTGRLFGISALFAGSNPVGTSKKIKGLQGLPHQGAAFRPEIRGLPAF